MEKKLDQHALARATRLLEVLYFTESRQILRIMETHKCIGWIDLLIQTGWEHNRLSACLGRLLGVGLVTEKTLSTEPLSYHLNMDKLLVVSQTIQILARAPRVEMVI